MNMLYEAIKEKGAMVNCAFVGCARHDYPLPNLALLPPPVIELFN